MPGQLPSIPFSTTIVASPAAAAETIICQVPLGSVAGSQNHVLVSGWAAFTVGTNGTAVRLRIREVGVAGTLVADSGALTGGIAAAGLVAQDIEGVDTPGEIASLLYVLTLQVTAGSTPSTVSAVKLTATVCQ